MHRVTLSHMRAAMYYIMHRNASHNNIVLLQVS